MTLYCVGVCFTICWMLGDSVLCWCLFSGWRQCWVTLYYVGVCLTICWMLGDSVLCWCLFDHMLDAG